ncbi:hypothetical protein H112_00202 [Trichophyton rubrum D6]|uniref:Uncharacterized protein n=3 Tax=Trichophyton TaxID=5550 RepID=A0A022WHJ9_TRIRU|nr:hypothetical protein H100_00202 [Trichophyton rubrum MR850]EZF46825.1 hypothetical protein H102_00201 [Trichophyton rubrum CBS 100081]EZF57548.1 hypothetical protein H103_00203 [Trichophyton rubrum CBS 288.86]EZF68075.1 hypothetical protein H104_00202 [Trichophyton rubrum CBS 289.86]EZF78733.1 hypothetical protein H105_00194 [Trichophyton soudanense CBS 452.61]EZF89430.1 hypothetical protein H110_00202 [Trichophyton rubrum MR1448]EZG00152.1 hypothetical protein H113_00204 [Trichophyton rub
MHYSYVALFTLLGLLSHAEARSCGDEYLYCGSTLQGKGWSQTELVNIINKDPFPNPNAVDDYRNALFQCGGSDNPFFVGYCNRGCVNEGSGHDDVCRDP